MPEPENKENTTSTGTVPPEAKPAAADAGADLPVVYPVPAGPDPVGSVGATLRALAPETAPGRV